MAGPPCGPGAEPPLGVCGERLTRDSATLWRREAFAESSVWQQPSMEELDPGTSALAEPFGVLDAGTT